MAVFVVPDPVNLAVVHSAPPTPASSVLTRLRLETRAEHDAVEGVLDLMDSTFTQNAYRQRLAQFYGFYQPLEAALQTRCSPQYEGLLPRLDKTRLLSQDLRYFDIGTEDLPLCHELPLVQSEAEVFGCLYVLEGATLGGRMITRHVQATLGIMPTTGGSFFEGYGSDTGKMWQAMQQLLLTCAIDTTTENAIVANAIATFASLRGWCELTNASQNNENDIEAEQSA